GDLASRSTAAPALPVAGASVELDSLLCSVISVGIGYPPIPSVSAERIKDQCAKIAHEEWPSIPGQPFWGCAKDTDKSEVSHCICTWKVVRAVTHANRHRRMSQRRVRRADNQDSWRCGIPALGVTLVSITAAINFRPTRGALTHQFGVKRVVTAKRFTVAADLTGPAVFAFSVSCR